MDSTSDSDTGSDFQEDENDRDEEEEEEDQPLSPPRNNANGNKRKRPVANSNSSAGQKNAAPVIKKRRTEESPPLNKQPSWPSISGGSPSWITRKRVASVNANKGEVAKTTSPTASAPTAKRGMTLLDYINPGNSSDTVLAKSTPDSSPRKGLSILFDFEEDYQDEKNDADRSKEVIEVLSTPSRSNNTSEVESPISTVRAAPKSIFDAFRYKGAKVAPAWPTAKKPVARTNNTSDWNTRSRYSKTARAGNSRARPAARSRTNRYHEDEDELDSSFIDDGEVEDEVYNGDAGDDDDEEEEFEAAMKRRQRSKASARNARANRREMTREKTQKAIRETEKVEAPPKRRLHKRSTGTKENGVDDEWTCSSCTLINDNGTECAVCGVSRDSAATIDVLSDSEEKENDKRKAKVINMASDEEEEEVDDDSEEEEESEEEPVSKFAAVDGMLQKCEQCAFKLSSAVSRIQKQSQDKASAKVEAEEEIIRSAPTSLQKQLKPHQLVGLNWLYLLHQKNLNGILADEMGLGKTIQTISLFALLAAKGNKGPHLVVVPASTLSNWSRELKIWCPSLKVCQFYGNQQERRQIAYEIRDQPRSPPPYNVMLTTYKVTQSKTDKGFLRKQNFEYLVLDEAQYIKNVDSLTHRAVSSIRAQHRLLLTGTPLQNDLDELFALLYFLLPQLFGKFHEYELIRRQLRLLAKQSDLSAAKKGKGKQKAGSGTDYILRIKEILSPFMLRRLKDEVSLGLLPKKERAVMTKMQPHQAELYAQILQRSKRMMEEHLAMRSAKDNKEAKKDDDEVNISVDDLDGLGLSQGETGTKINKATGGKVKIHTLINNLLMQLRKMSNHPLLCRSYRSNNDVEDIARLLKKHDPSFQQERLQDITEFVKDKSDFCLHATAVHAPYLSQYCLTSEQLYQSSGKFQQLRKLLAALHKDGHRVLIFSQMTKMLDILESFMDHLNYQYLRLDGSTPVLERQAKIDQYNENEDIFVFLLSTRAGGLGINLTSADTVIFYDIGFNPQVERQAEDRCHRLGQERQVTVYRLITAGTIDEHILKMANQKKELSECMLSEGQYALSSEGEGEGDDDLTRQIQDDASDLPVDTGGSLRLFKQALTDLVAAHS